MPTEKPKPELLQEDNSVRIEDLEKKIMILEGYAQKTEFFIKSLDRKVKKIKEKRLQKILTSSLEGGF
ncbi:hypothetical protein AMJ44_04415 [candidate division WOR-1 bacterium DG_54_3]|uniref:Uncharacterized protein n=1 Tax=candidate division WOR-1 bacterium DG_54_3 TaxID=1703775 RepID=A0A0S7Y3J4_UNCSA|nr:MAG: hypothetical protein AMJ44_04415 [candidate division WOR-1 bacterium DG_54_3]